MWFKYSSPFTLSMSSTSKDPVRPSNDAFEAAFAHGYRTWYHLHHLAREKGHDQVIRQSARTIDRALPQYPKLPAKLAISSPVQGIALAKGTITWNVHQDDGESQPMIQEMRLQMAFPSPVKVIYTLDNAAKLESPQSLFRADSHVATLFLAWAYILSARWTELLSNPAVIRYTKSDGSDSACLGGIVSDETSSGLDHVGDNARQWWHRVLAGSGWEARLVVEGQREMYSPWSISLDRERGQQRRRAGTRPAKTTAGRAASFSEAMGYLQEFTNHHGVHDQSRAALAAALFIPVARHDRRDIHLQRPWFEGGDVRVNEAQHLESAAFEPTTSLVDRLLLLGCNTFGIKALLCSTFYEPHILCNLSGAWIQGFMKPVMACDPANSVCALILRDPDIGFLWMGAFLTGIHKTCLEQISRGLWRVDLNVGSLTGTPMSFVQEELALDTTASSLSRANECKLRYVHQSNIDAPNFAFPPFGTTVLENLDLEVRLHLRDTNPQQTQVRHVTWETTSPARTTVTLLSAPVRQKIGYRSQPDIEIPRLSSEEHNVAEDCSKTSTRRAFGWLREAPAIGGRVGASETSVMVEGGVNWTPEERDIFEHEWLRGFFSVACADEEVGS